MQNLNDLLINCIRTREPLPEPTIGLRALLEAEGTAGYIKLCAKRISDAKYIDGKIIDLDLTDPYNLLMTYEGMFASSEILEGYCDHERLQNYIKALMHASKCFEKINRQASDYRLLSKGTLRVIKNHGVNDNSVDNTIKNLAAEELKARKMHNVIIRKFVQSASKIKLMWKIRHTLIRMLLTQHIGS